jgi:hypothetical protein
MKYRLTFFSIIIVALEWNPFVQPAIAFTELSGTGELE